MSLIPLIQQLDEMIARTAPPAELRARLALLHAKAGALEQLLAGFSEKIKQLEMAADLDPPALRILQVFLETDAPHSAEDLAAPLSLTEEAVKHHFAALTARGFIQWAGLAMDSSPLSNVITQAGREFASKTGPA
jgi:DNA-binding MarR family transcriptional regulator